jgi:Flp pilus assembly protein TadD
MILAGVGSLLAVEKGTVTGIVASLSRSPIVGAKVTLAADDGSRQSITADQNGRYSFNSLKPGSYTISAEAPGYQTATRTAVRVVGGSVRTVDLLLAAPPDYYDDTQLKAGGVTNATDAAGYSSQAQSPRRLLGEGPNLTGNPPKGSAAKPLNEFERAVQMDPSEKNLFDLGNELLLHERIEPALVTFKRGVTLYPASVRMRIGLGLAFYSRGSYDAAVDALCDASDLNPSDPRPYLFLGKMYGLSKGRAKQVAESMKRFMQTNPDNALAYYYYAISLWKDTGGVGQGSDLAEVEALLRKSISLDPRSADAHLQLGIVLHNQHRDAEAIPQFQAAVQLKPDDPNPHYRLAQAYARTGDSLRAQEEFQVYNRLRQQQWSGRPDA